VMELPVAVLVQLQMKARRNNRGLA